MRTVTTIADAEEFRVQQVRICAADMAWTIPETPGGHRVMLVRRGVFRARVGGHRFVADPATAYYGDPVQEQSIAHRAGVEDVCTAIVMSDSFACDLLRAAPPRSLLVTAELAVAHRLLVAAARSGADAFELTERTARLLDALFEGRSQHSPVTGRESTAAARRRLTDSVRELLSTDLAGRRLEELARLLGCSPAYLSRIFHQQTGTTISRYRNRLRVLAALEAIEAGEQDFAGLAARLGFADHAHLTRTIRKESGHTPRALRRLLTQPKSADLN
jgi:AraC-like DNA-binding protein